ncbi:MAG: hypothetical protein JNL11_13280 [Bdellovibrionaceae bacterium]|nr:hypothetical protein [Pseudobdellovibrionaceae bacterium]
MKTFLFLIFVFFCHASLASFSVGNGGDLVQCRPQPGSPFNGHYSLDFLVTYQISSQYKVLPTASLQQSLDRIYKNLTLKVPTIAKNFYDFARNYKNTTNFMEKYIWEIAQFGLADLKDERIVSLFPPNCVSDNKVQLIQTIIRQVRDHHGDTKVIFKYDPRIIDPLEKANPLQVSFLLVHEWLWNYTANVEVLRKVNWFLHTNAFDMLSATEVTKQLAGLGIQVPTEDPSAVAQLECTHDIIGLDSIVSRIFVGLGSREFRVAKFEPYILRRLCNSYAGCRDSSIVRPFSRDGFFSRSPKYFAEDTFISFLPYGQPMSLIINLRSPNTGHVFSQCDMNLGTNRAKCADQYIWHDQSLTDMRMKLYMNRECLKIVSTVRHPASSRQGQTYWFEDDYIIFSRYRLDQM